MKIYTKEMLIQRLREIKELGWIPNARLGNQGGVGNTLEDLLEIQENNLPIPNASEWELKCQRLPTSSPTTLFHMEPSPRTLRFVPAILLPKYGWAHKKAGEKHPIGEMSFRQTINGLSPTDRGFSLAVNESEQKVSISFNSSMVDSRHSDWLLSVEKRVGHLNDLNPQPYWGFMDLFHKTGTKLLNTFYVQAECKKEGGIEYFKYDRVMILRELSFDKFINALKTGALLVDFDARSGHNHGTKFRLRPERLPELYGQVEIIA